jgi:uncharacterized protein (TIGR00303 family)
MVRLRPIAVYVGGSTLTSLRPGVSIAGPSPEGTLYTPTLDLEYLALGMPRTLNIVPVSPEGLPTPAVLTRAVLQLVDVPYLIVDAGTYYGIKAPHVKLPSARPGNDIAEQDALPPGTAAALFSEGESLGAMVARGHDLVLIGESIPGGTTVAAAVMTALGFEGVGLVSSASPDNPKVIKRQIVLRALSRAKGVSDPLRLVDIVGDPVHVAMAGIASGALSRGAQVMLAGGTQMGAVLSIMRSLGRLDPSRVAVATTRWIAEDRSADIRAIAKDVGLGVRLLVADLDFSDSPYRGLAMYEEGFVKEGVGAGGTAVLANMLGVSYDVMKRAIYEEYGRLLSLGGAKPL